MRAKLRYTSLDYAESDGLALIRRYKQKKELLRDAKARAIRTMQSQNISRITDTNIHEFMSRAIQEGLRKLREDTNGVVRAEYVPSFLRAITYEEYRSYVGRMRRIKASKQKRSVSEYVSTVVVPDLPWDVSACRRMSLVLLSLHSEELLQFARDTGYPLVEAIQLMGANSDDVPWNDSNAIRSLGEKRT